MTDIQIGDVVYLKYPYDISYVEYPIFGVVRAISTDKYRSTCLERVGNSYSLRRFRKLNLTNVWDEIFVYGPIRQIRDYKDVPND